MAPFEWIVGRNPVYETLRAGRRQCRRLLVAQGVQEKGHLEEAIALARQKRVPVERVGRGQVERHGDGNQGVALECGTYPYVDFLELLEESERRGEAPFLLLLDALQDPQNLGTLLRTAEVVGVHGVLLPYRRTATVTPAVVSASSGASEHLLVAQANIAQSIDALKQEGVWVVGLEGESPEDNPVEVFYPDQIDLNRSIALVVGSEGQGMRSLVRASCDFLLRLPMRGKIESLNAATAGSIALFLTWQARGFPSR